MREVLLEVMEDKGGVEKASLKVERLCALLDPRPKALGADYQRCTLKVAAAKIGALVSADVS